MNAKDLIIDNTERVSGVINQAVSEIISSYVDKGSAFYSIIQFLAWLVIAVSLIYVLKTVLRFLINSVISIIQIFTKIPAIWKVKKESFPNKTFDPFDNIPIARTRLHGKRKTNVWAILGTQREFLVGLDNREIVSRKILAISIIVTVLMAAFGSFSFASGLSGKAGFGFFQKLFSCITAIFIYCSIIYSFDISIITAGKVSPTKAALRMCFAFIMAIVLGSQLNIEFHKDHLTQKLKEDYNIKDIDEEISKKEGEKAAQEVKSRDSQSAITANETIIKSFTPDATTVSSLKSEISRLEKDLNVLRCMQIGEQSSGNFMGCNPPSGYYQMNLNLDAKRGGGPKAPDCAGQNSASNYCKIKSKVSEYEVKLADNRAKLNTITDPVRMKTHVDQSVAELEKFSNQKSTSDEVIAKVKSKLETLREKKKKLEDLSDKSETNLMRMLYYSMYIDLKGAGDGSGYWMIMVFVVLVMVDMFSVIAKFFARSNVYDARVEAFEEAEMGMARSYGKAFSTKYIDGEPVVKDIDDEREEDRERHNDIKDSSDASANDNKSFYRDFARRIINRILAISSR